MLNFQTPKTIDYCKATWNPIAGCRGPGGKPCKYCYLIAMSKRFKTNLMKPAFYPERLKDIKSKKLNPGDVIFVGSGGDMWGEWVPDSWINFVLMTIKEFPQYKYLFLTKNPIRYRGYQKDFTENIYIGTTIDGNSFDNVHRLTDFSQVTGVNKFISFEPLLEDPFFKDYFELMDFKWFIIGGESGGSKKPDEWATKLIRIADNAGVPVWLKNNYKYFKKIKNHPFGVRK